MYLPVPILILLIVMALPTAFVIVATFDDAMQRGGRRFIGSVDDFRRDGTYDISTHLLYIRVWRRTGTHSTAPHD